jgi:hypothetical protein
MGRARRGKKHEGHIPRPSQPRFPGCDGVTRSGDHFFVAPMHAGRKPKKRPKFERAGCAWSDFRHMGILPMNADAENSPNCGRPARSTKPRSEAAGSDRAGSKSCVRPRAHLLRETPSHCRAEGATRMTAGTARAARCVRAGQKHAPQPVGQPLRQSVRRRWQARHLHYGSR